MDIQQLVNAVATALTEAFNMAWEVFWPLILGFALSGAVQAVVSHKSMARLLGDDSPRSLTFATLFSRRFELVLVRGCRAGAISVPQGRQLHRRDGV